MSLDDRGALSAATDLRGGPAFTSSSADRGRQRLRRGPCWLQSSRFRGSGGFSAESLAAILRTFFGVFDHGALYWGASNVIAVGSREPLPESSAARFADLPASVRRLLAALAVRDVAELTRRRPGDARVVREALPAGEVLRDDKPTLEAVKLWQPATTQSELEILEAIVREQVAADPRAEPLWLFLESRAARAAGKSSRADTLLTLAEQSGLALAGRARLELRVTAAVREAQAGAPESAMRSLRAVLADESRQSSVRYALAILAFEARQLEIAQQELLELMSVAPGHIHGLSLLGLVEHQRGNASAARSAYRAALDADPFYAPALANAGLLALGAGDRREANAYLERLRAIAPLAPSPEQLGLANALGAIDAAAR